MFKQPQDSPWGKVQECRKLCIGVFEVSTPSHGGIMVDHHVESFLSRRAKKYGFREGGYLCFEEDAAANVALRELLDQRLIRTPSYISLEAYSRNVDECLQRFYPDYWREHETGRSIEGQVTFEEMLEGKPAAKSKCQEVR